MDDGAWVFKLANGEYGDIDVLVTRHYVNELKQAQALKKESNPLNQQWTARPPDSFPQGQLLWDQFAAKHPQMPIADMSRVNRHRWVAYYVDGQPYWDSLHEYLDLPKLGKRNSKSSRPEPLTALK